MTKDRFTTMAERLEALRKIVTNLVWLAVLLVILAGIGKIIVFLGMDEVDQALKNGTSTTDTQRPTRPTVDWRRVDADVAEAVEKAGDAAESFATELLGEWINSFMERVDNDFLDWYFSYWTQQVMGLRGLWQSGVHFFFSSQPTAAEKITETVQNQFANQVLRPEIAQMELEKIARRTVDLYVDALRQNLERIPETYNIPRAEWERYLDEFAMMTARTDGSRSVPLTLKTLVASGAGGTVLVGAEIGKMAGKVMGKSAAKAAGKTSGKLAAKTGTKVAAKSGGKFLGPIIGIGILIWDIWDHHRTKEVNRPVLRRAFADYFEALKDQILNDARYGIRTTFLEMERRIYETVRARKR